MFTPDATPGNPVSRTTDQATEQRKHPIYDLFQMVDVPWLEGTRVALKAKAAIPSFSPWMKDSVRTLRLRNGSAGLVAAVRKKLRDLGYTAESLGGYKVKEVADMFSVPPARVEYWVAEKLLLTKGGYHRELICKIPF